MSNFIGEFDCKLDPKGRLMVPSGLRKQIDPAANDILVINRGFEQCLVLYPKNEWVRISAEVNQLNQYIKKNRDFIRYFYRGATELTLDGTGRVLVPRRLQEYAGLGKEVVLFAYSDRIELWDKQKYDSLLTDEPEDFASLAEDVMGNKDDNQHADGLS
jgi:MraZ protein